MASRAAGNSAVVNSSRVFFLAAIAQLVLFSSQKKCKEGKMQTRIILISLSLSPQLRLHFAYLFPYARRFLASRRTNSAKRTRAAVETVSSVSFQTAVSLSSLRTFALSLSLSLYPCRAYSALFTEQAPRKICIEIRLMSLGACSCFLNRIYAMMSSSSLRIACGGN